MLNLWFAQRGQALSHMLESLVFCPGYFFTDICGKIKVAFRLVNDKKDVYIRFRLTRLCMVLM